MTEIDSETSLRDDLEAGLDSVEVEAPIKDALPDQALPENPIPAELPPMEAPSMWGKQYKETFSQLAQTPEQRAAAEAWLNQWKETQGYITKRDQEYADYRKRFDPLHEVLSPYESHWRMNGMDTVTGVRQLVSYAEALQKDPAAMIPQLAQMYGVDLQSLVAEQPYVDPQVQALQERIAQFEQAQQYQQVQQQQVQYHRLTEEIRAFETAADEQGNLKAPHFQRVFNTMVALANARDGQGKPLVSSIQDAYDRAVILDKDLQSEIAEAKAKQDAAARAADAQKAAAASRTVKSKSTTETLPEKSIRDALAEGLGIS